MIESMLFSFFSFTLGLLLAWMALPFFNQLATKNLQFPWSEWWLLPGIASAAFIVGILAGAYPSFYLSAFKPIEVLRGNLSLGSRSSSLRSSLVLFQFTISVVLIIATTTIYRQMDYFLNRDVGFDREQVLLIQGTSTIRDRMQIFKDELMRLPVVSAVAVSNYLPVTGGTRNQNTFSKVGEENGNNSVSAQLWRVDHDYVKAMGMRIVQGRDFSKELATDSIGGPSAIINRRMAKEFGFENPIGQQFTNRQTWTIVGVIDDFQTMRDDAEAVALVIGNSTGTVSVKLSATDMQAALLSIDQVWKTFAPHQPIRYTFLDDTFARMYSDVQRTGNIFTSFAVLAVAVACLGLFALSAFMMEQRNKEISIRLVLGASVGSIFNLLTINFLKLIVLSIVLAVPIGWYMMNTWLTGFKYKAPIGWDVFAVAGIMSIVIALATISFHAIKAGMARAVDGLRRE